MDMERHGVGPERAPGSLIAPFLPSAQALAYPPAGYQYTVSPKSPALSLIVSFFLPGVGSLINGDTGIGITILLLWLLSLVLDITVLGAIIGVPLGLGMFTWGLVDGYQGAVRWNARHGIIS